jgi:hypothetical protein
MAANSIITMLAIGIAERRDHELDEQRAISGYHYE